MKRMRYIGYSTLEHLIDRLPPQQTLYLTLTEQLIPGASGIALYRSELMLQASVSTATEDTIRYWRMVIGEAVAPSGEPWPEDLTRIRRAGKSTLEAVKQYLASRTELGPVEEGAIIAVPRNLKLLRGQASSLRFDKASGTYHLKEG